jgi:hypothetical protein
LNAPSAPNASTIRILVLTGVPVLDALLQRVRLDVVDVVRVQLHDRAFVGADRSLDLVLHDLFVLAFDEADDLVEAASAARRS